MNRLIKLFALQTLVVAIVAIPVSLYIRSDYREFRDKQELASRVPAGVGAVCRDGWYSGSTGSGTCSHHGGVNYWGSELRQISQTTWPRENSLLFIILAAALVGWYGYGVRALHRKHATGNHNSTSAHLQRQCCTDSLAEGLRFCSVCDAALTPAETSTSTVSPAITYVLVAATAFLTIAVVILGIVYFRARQDAIVAAAVTPSPTVSPTPPSTPTPTAKLTPTPTPDDLEEYLDPPVDEPLPKTRQTPTPTPEPEPPLTVSRERVVSTPTPRRTYPESLVDASDVLLRDSRIYRFHLSQPARAKGNFSARGNITVYIVGGYYSSNGAM